MYNVEYLIAHRTAQSDRSSRSSVMTRIAVITVALGVAAILLTLAVVRGFRREMYADLRGFNADISIVDVATLSGSERLLPYSEALVERCAAIEGVESIAPYVVVGGMAKCGDNVLGLQIKGIDATYDTSWWQSRLVEGALPDFESESRTKQLLISQATARKLEAAVGDKLELLYVDSDSSPRRDSFRIAGIYSTGMEEMDLTLAIADVRDVRRLAGWSDDLIMGYDVMLHKAERADAVAAEIDLKIEELPLESGVTNALATTMQMRNPVVFDWLMAHTIIAQAVIIIMMVVLLFNVAAAMLIMVFDRIGMIGVLKAQGMRNKAIARIFLYRAALLFFKGAVWGNAIGLALVVVQALWHPVSLDPEGYMLSELPVSFGWGWWLALNVGAVAVTVAVMVVPSMIVSRIRCEESLKYKL